MAELKKRSVSVENVGHFYYDWGLSRYKWTSGDIGDKQYNIANSKDGLSNENDKLRAKKNFVCSPVLEDFISMGLNEEDLKKPLRDRDVNQPVREEQDPIKPKPSENELSSIHQQGIVCGRKKSIQGKGSPTESKDEAFEIAKGHATMMTVLSARLLKLRAAETLWHKDTNAFVEYILRLKDDSILVDVMPFLTSRVKENAPEGRALSMGACLEMLPVLERLLASKFEDYIVAALNMVREMIKRWWSQLKAATSKGSDPEYYRCSRSVNGLYMAMVSISAVIVRLKKRRGIVGQKALIVSRLLDLL